MRKASFLFAGLFLVGALPSCDPPPPKGPNPTRTLDERRAVEIIRNAISAEGQRPAAGRDDVVTGTDKPIHVDVSVDGRKFGVVYVSDDDLTALGSAIQPPNQKDEKLHLARAGKDGDVRVVLLYQTNYRYDDLVGDDHEQTAITCENQLTKDVRDFVTHALTHKFE